MKPSEVRLLEMVNRNNHMRIDSKRVSFGGPRVSPDRRHNTWIEIFASPEDKQYDRSTTVQYNRLDSRSLGDKSVVDVEAYDLTHAIGALLRVLDKVYNIPCSESELLKRSQVLFTETKAIVVYDFNNHPLVYGTITARLKLGSGELSTVITNTDLSGFSLDDVSDRSLNDEILITHLTGFLPSDVR